MRRRRGNGSSGRGDRVPPQIEHEHVDAELFVELLDRYERVRYGHAAVARESFADFSHRAERVRAAALSGSPQTPL